VRDLIRQTESMTAVDCAHFHCRLRKLFYFSLAFSMK
jgi:hypothetical protein